MNVNLLLDNPGDVRSGYLNIDNFAQPNDKYGRIPGDVFSLSLIDDGELTELIVLDILDYVPACKLDEVLENWLRKLGHGGTITVSVVDIREVSRAIFNNRLSIDDANELIHGKQEKEWQFKKIVVILRAVVSVF
jgi:hypothetical protein